MSTEAKRYWKVFGVALGILVLELAGGWWSGSLALLSDAFHVFIDTLAIIIAIFVAILVRRYPKSERSLRSLGGEIQGGSLLIIAIWIVYEALERFLSGDNKIIASVMIVVAVAGCLGNFWQHRILSHSEDHEKNLTHLGLAWHVLSDFWQSFVVIASGLLIWATHKTWIDLVASLILAVVFFSWGVVLMRKAQLSASIG